MSLDDPLKFVIGRYDDGVLCQNNKIGEDPDYGVEKACWILEDDDCEEIDNSNNSEITDYSEWECEDSDSETGTVYREETTVACSEEDMITTVADCEKALYDLSPAGYTWMGQYSHAERIPGCRWDSNHKNFAFNTYKNPKNTTK
jgi:hypothetical protein